MASRCPSMIWERGPERKVRNWPGRQRSTSTGYLGVPPQEQVSLVLVLYTKHTVSDSYPCRLDRMLAMLWVLCVRRMELRIMADRSPTPRLRVPFKWSFYVVTLNFIQQSTTVVVPNNNLRITHHCQIYVVYILFRTTDRFNL